MTRHGMIQPRAAGTQPSATNPRELVVIIDAEEHAPGRTTRRQHRAEAQRSDLSAPNAALPDTGRAIADTGRRSKSP